MRNKDESKIRRAALARNIKRLRERAGLSQNQLSKKSDVAQTAISYLEREDGKSPTWDTIEKIADTFGVHPFILLTDLPENFAYPDISGGDFVLRTYLHSPPDGQAQLRRIAEAEARYIVDKS